MRNALGSCDLQRRIDVPYIGQSRQGSPAFVSDFLSKPEINNTAQTELKLQILDVTCCQCL
jgi:hypothetical protein